MKLTAHALSDCIFTGAVNSAIELATGGIRESKREKKKKRGEKRREAEKGFKPQK